MTYRPKRKAPPALTKKLIQAHYNSQAPLEHDMVEYRRKKPKKWTEDDINDIGDNED